MSKKTERLSVSLFTADMKLLLKLRRLAEERAGDGKPMALAPIVRDAIQCLAKERGVS